MNKILIDKNIIGDSNNIKIDKNKVTFLVPGEYEILYDNDGKYNLEFIIDCDIKLIESSFDKNLEINNHYIINKGKLEIIKFYNCHDVTEKVDIDLVSDGCKVDYKFTNICKEKEYYEININHLCKNTESNIINKSVALKNSALKFVINSNVKRECVNSVLNQNTRIVTMDECDASISPNMFIDLDDVVAKHGSIIGTFKEDDIFYLMSKGINYNDTLKLLIKGYLLANLDVHEGMKNEIINIIDVYWR